MSEISTGSAVAFFICIIFLYFFVIWYLTKTLITVNQSQVVIIEKFGKFSRILSPGLHWISIFESPREIYQKHLVTDPYSHSSKSVVFTTNYVDLREQILDVPARQFITRDTVLIRLDALVFFRIVDPLSVYAVSNLPDSLELLCVSSLRNIVASLTLDETFSSRGSLNTILKRQLEADCSRYGIVINRVCIEEVIISQDVILAMEIQKKEERHRIAAIITAGAEREIDIIKSKGTAARMVLSSEGEKHAMIARATGKAQAKVIASTAEAECFAVLQEALQGDYRAADYMYACQYLARWKTTAKDTDVVLFPERGYQNVVTAQ